MKQHDQLVIKSGNGYVLMMIYGFSIILLGGVVFAIAEKSIVGAVLVFGLPLLLMISYWVATGRTIKLDRYGCEVTFLGYRKKYLWEEMKYRKYENAESYRFYKTLFLESVFFSRKNNMDEPGMVLHMETSVFDVFCIFSAKGESETVTCVYLLCRGGRI